MRPDLTGVRQDIADALDTVDGVTGYLKAPGTARVGDAFPHALSMARSEAGPFLSEWTIVVLLAADETVVLESMEDLVPPLDDALRPVGYVTEYALRAWSPKSGASLPAIQITMIRE